MNVALPFQRSAIHPIQCFQEAWARVRDAYGLFLGITLVGLIIGSAVPFGILMGPMMCGMAQCYLDKGRGKTVAFNQLFKGFDHFSESLIAMLILLGASLALMLPIFAVAAIGGLLTAWAAAEQNTGGMVLSILLVIVGFLALMVASLAMHAVMAFVFPLIADRRMKGFEALKLSARAAFANPGGLLGLCALSLLLSLAGMCLCYIGAFLVVPITLGAQIIAYEQVFGAAPVEEPESDDSSPETPAETGPQA